MADPATKPDETVTVDLSKSTETKKAQNIELMTRDPGMQVDSGNSDWHFLPKDGEKTVGVGAPNVDNSFFGSRKGNSIMVGGGANVQPKDGDYVNVYEVAGKNNTVTMGTGAGSRDGEASELMWVSKNTQVDVKNFDPKKAEIDVYTEGQKVTPVAYKVGNDTVLSLGNSSFVTLKDYKGAAKDIRVGDSTMAPKMDQSFIYEVKDGGTLTPDQAKAMMDKGTPATEKFTPDELKAETAKQQDRAAKEDAQHKQFELQNARAEAVKAMAGVKDEIKLAPENPAPKPDKSLEQATMDAAKAAKAANVSGGQDHNSKPSMPNTQPAPDVQVERGGR